MVVAPGARPWISIIIPCKDQAAELRDCLQGLQHQAGDLSYEVLVVDSAYDPGVEQTANSFPGVRLIRSHDDLSAGAARNFGVKHAAGTVLGFIDADCIPDPGWVQAARGIVEAGAVLAGGPILDALPWNWIASTDNRLQFADFPAGRPAGTNPYFPGAHLVVLREAFDAVGGFHEGSNVVQDVLFSEAAATRWPGKTLFFPDLVVRHRGRTRWHAFLQHQWQFGHARAQWHLRMNDTLTRLGRHASLAWIVVLRRWLYISARVVQWNLPDLPRYLWQSPLILIGLVAWTQGFYAGMRPAARDSS